jgi:hypothetical protein
MSTPKQTNMPLHILKREAEGKTPEKAPKKAAEVTDVPKMDSKTVTTRGTKAMTDQVATSLNEDPLVIVPGVENCFVVFIRGRRHSSVGRGSFVTGACISLCDIHTAALTITNRVHVHGICSEIWFIAPNVQASMQLSAAFRGHIKVQAHKIKHIMNPELDRPKNSMVDVNAWTGKYDFELDIRCRSVLLKPQARA